MSKRKSLISVIVPIYNAEKFLSRCVDSIINQTYKNLEIILINDGSTDRTLDILKKYKKIDSRVIIIDKINEGVSVARNVGLKKASGEYIYFSDADDYLDSKILETYHKGIQESDMVISDYNIVDEKSNINKADSFPKDMTIDSIDEIDNLKMSLLCNNYKHINTQRGDYKGNGLGFVWNKLFKKAIIDENNILFPKGVILSEDVCFIYKYLDNCTSIKIISKALYFHEILKTGATLRYKPEIIESERRFVDETWFITNTDNKKIREAYYGRLIRMLSWDFMFYIFHGENKEDKKALISSVFEQIPEYKIAIKKAKYCHLTIKQAMFLFLIRLKQYWIISIIMQ